MGQIEIGLSPIIAQTGPLALRWYSLAILAAIAVAVAVTRRELTRKGLWLQPFDVIVVGTVAGGVLGARLLHVIDHPAQFIEHPARILALQEGGLAIYGAVIGGFAAVGCLSRIYHFPFLPVIDAIAPGLVLAQAIGRLGCIVNGDAWGTPTSSPMAFVYTNADAMLPQNLLAVPTHPYPLYDMAINLLVFVALWQLRTRRLPDGMLFAAFVALYAPGRFLVSFVREERSWVWGLQEAQIIALIALTGALLALGWLWRQTHAAARQRAAVVTE